MSPLLWATLALHPALDAGDRAWGRGDGAIARTLWEQVADEGDPASVAMAELRLLQVSGNLGLLVHGPRADAALADCPPRGAGCALAAADYLLFTRRLGLPADLDGLDGLLAEAAVDQPTAALARKVEVGAAPLADLRAAADRDGYGDVLVAHEGRWPTGPGTWVLGLGPVGAGGLGAGGSLGFVHPDLQLRGDRLQASLLATSAGAFALSASLSRQGRPGQHIEAQAGHLPVGGGRRGFADQAELIGGPALKGTAGALWLGPGLRLAKGPKWSLGAAGAWTPPAWDPTQLRLPVEAYGGAEPVVRGAVDLRGGAGLFAARALVDGAWAAPRTGLSRLPGAGGGLLLRSGRYARFRGPLLAGAVVEARPTLKGPLGAALFAEGARLDGFHGGLGAGLRLRLPPQPTNTLRLDIAWGDAGLGITAGLGEAF